MTDPATGNAALQRQRALSRWDNEGRASAHAVPPSTTAEPVPIDDPVLSNAELVQLRIRVIALENMLIAILAKASDEQHKMIRDMADLISPRPDAVQHPLTIRAAEHMRHIVDRARHFRLS